jgi:hypothetical protein
MGSRQSLLTAIRIKNFLKVLILALLKGYETSMRNGYLYRAMNTPGMPTSSYGILVRQLASLLSIPQHVEVPPNIEAKRIISYFSAVLSY